MAVRAPVAIFQYPWIAGLDADGGAASGASGMEREFISFDEANNLLETPAAAERRATEILTRNAIDPVAIYLQAAAFNRQERHQDARTSLDRLARSQPQMGAVWRELGLACEHLGERRAAADAYLKAFDLNVMDEAALQALARLLPFCATEELAEAREPAEATRDGRLDAADAAIRSGRFEPAEGLLREALEARPENAPALAMLAHLMVRRARWSDAAALYERCLALAPEFGAARFAYASMLYLRREFLDALPHFERLLKAEPGIPVLRALKALALAGAGLTNAAAAEFQSFNEDCTEQPGLWLEYARVLREAGDEKAPAALRRAMEILPSFIEAYVLYASIKPFRWEEWMIDQVRAQLARRDLAGEDRAHLHFALGKACEDEGRYGESFENYRRCNEILRRGGDRSARASAGFVRRTMNVFSPALLRRCSGFGHPARDPIFIVGMKRSGSTLVEQILSRHSAIEALGELEDLTAVVGGVKDYPGVLKECGANRFRAMGEEYLALTAPRRKLSRPFFTDKLPHNFGRIGLIALILPNARIVDVRRHPLDCGLSCYKHYFPGSRLSLSLDDLGSGYVDYVKLMAHFDRLLPGKVHRLVYERLVGNFEHEVRRLLDYLGLPFEEACLRFHENTRQVLTPSVDQVRRPLYSTAAGYWRNFEPWLGPLKDALGYVLDVYPEVPGFYDEVHVRMRRPLALGQTGRQYSFVKGLSQMRIDGA